MRFDTKFPPYATGTENQWSTLATANILLDSAFTAHAHLPLAALVGRAEHTPSSVLLIDAVHISHGAPTVSNHRIADASP